MIIPADVGLAREALARSSHRSQIESVEDGVEAMAFLNRRGKYVNASRPDLVILDLNLAQERRSGGPRGDPGGTGLRRIPVVVFSTSQLRKDVLRSYELGASCYVSKPGNLKDFFSAMKSIEEFWFGFVSLPSQGE